MFWFPTWSLISGLEHAWCFQGPCLNTCLSPQASGSARTQILHQEGEKWSSCSVLGRFHRCFFVSELDVWWTHIQLALPIPCNSWFLTFSYPFISIINTSYLDFLETVFFFWLKCNWLNTVVLIFAVQQCDCYMHIYIYIYIYSYSYSFPYGLSQDVEYSSLCYTVGPCWPILHIIVCICESQTPNNSLPHPSPPWQPEVCSLCLWIYFVDKFICVIF